MNRRRRHWRDSFTKQSKAMNATDRGRALALVPRTVMLIEALDFIRASSDWIETETLRKHLGEPSRYVRRLIHQLAEAGYCEITKSRKKNEPMRVKATEQ